MSWKSGTELFSSLIDTVMKNVPDDDSREEIYRDMVAAFQGHDWDNLQDMVGYDDAYDAVYYELYPEEGEEEDDREELDFEE